MGELRKYKKLNRGTAIALVRSGNILIWRYRSLFISVDFAYSDFKTFKEFKNFAKKLNKGV